MRNEDYIVTQGWMYDIPLTDKQRTIYALIWGYSRDGRSCWRGTAKDLAEWAGCQERNAKKIVRQLEDRGLIAHTVVAWSDGTGGGVRSEFWAVLPDSAAAPGKGNKGRINWVRKGRRGRVPQDPRGRALECPRGSVPECPTPYTDSSSIHTSGGCGKNNARSRAKKATTTTTFSLFENGENYREPVIPADLAADPLFLDWWGKLLKQPGWQGKTPEAMEIELANLDALNDPVQAAWTCMKVIQRGWNTIRNAPQMFVDDMDEAQGWITDEYNRRRAAK